MSEVPRVAWDAATGPARLRAAILEHGSAIVPLGEGAATEAAREPWDFAARLLGERPLLVERQPIRPVPSGRSFASNRALAPLHTDSQQHLGVPADLQVLACARAADEGGETTLVDAWALLARTLPEDPALHARLFDETRTLPFYFGRFEGPTVASRRGRVFFTHPPAPFPGDRLGALVQSRIDREPRTIVRVQPGDVLLVDDHRVLHGRLPFVGERSLARVLVWSATPFPAPDAVRARARGLPFPHSDLDAAAVASARLGVVLELLRGVPPGVLSAREGIAEKELYRWRDAALAAAIRGLRAE